LKNIILHMNSKQFLQIGGVILVLVGILGYVGILGPTAADSVFGATWWFDAAENIAHLVLGVVALIAAYVLPASAQKPLAMLVGIVAILVGLYSIMGESMLLGATLENPADTILHLVVGVWAVWASMQNSDMATM
jgi:hypothetical protein